MSVTRNHILPMYGSKTIIKQPCGQSHMKIIKEASLSKKTASHESLLTDVSVLDVSLKPHSDEGDL